MVRFSWVVALGTVGLGCSTTYVQGPATQTYLQAVQSKHTGAVLWVTPLPRAGRTSGDSFRLVGQQPDVTIVGTGPYEPVYSIPNREIGSVHLNDHAVGGLYGGGAGALIAAALLVPYWVTGTPCFECYLGGDRMPDDQDKIITTMLVTMLSTAVGATAGAALGFRTEYVFQQGAAK
jgi:hypothetical protein